jgi:DNA-directed RNA polymerase subunit beta
MLEHKLLKSFAKLPETLEIPDLIQVQLDSFRWFQEEGLRELFEEISPIQDYTGTRLELHFVDYEFREPQHSIAECLERGLT